MDQQLYAHQFNEIVGAWAEWFSKEHRRCQDETWKARLQTIQSYSLTSCTPNDLRHIAQQLRPVKQPAIMVRLHQFALRLMVQYPVFCKEYRKWFVTHVISYNLGVAPRLLETLLKESPALLFMVMWTPTHL